MIIWINGAFGSGKTTIASILKKKLVDSFIYDPENIGDFLRHNLPKSIQKEDFQEYVEWREWNLHMLKKIAEEYAGDIIVPMTLYKQPAFSEIIQELKNSEIIFLHFQLEVPRDEIIKRLQERNQAVIKWGTTRVDEIIAAFEEIPQEEKVENIGRTPEEVADIIIAKLNE